MHNKTYRKPIAYLSMSQSLGFTSWSRYQSRIVNLDMRHRIDTILILDLPLMPNALSRLDLLDQAPAEPADFPEHTCLVHRDQSGLSVSAPTRE